MDKLRGKILVTLLVVFPIVCALALVVRSRAVAMMETAAAREAVLSVLSSLPSADATPSAAQGTEASAEDAPEIDKAALAFLKALQGKDYKAAWALMHPEGRGSWTFEEWRTLRESMEGGDSRPYGRGREDLIFMLMGKSTELKEVATRGMEGLARVSVHADVPVQIVLKRVAGGGWAVDLAATDDIVARRKIGEQIAGLSDTSSGEGFFRAMMATEAALPWGMDMAALVGPEAAYAATSRTVSGDRVTVEMKGRGTFDLAVPLANGEQGWGIAWNKGAWPWPEGKTIAQVMAAGPEDHRGPRDSRNATCQSNLKQIALGLMMYAQDYDERFPPADRWQSGALPYIRNRGLFICPADRGAKATSYATNYKLDKLGVSQVTQPADTFMLFESNLHVYNAYDKGRLPGASIAWPPRHELGNNYAYTDGHVGWLSSMGASSDAGFIPPPPPTKGGVATKGAPKGWQGGAPFIPYPDKYRVTKTGEPDFPWMASAGPRGGGSAPPPPPNAK
jgi:prepilin-type processing-associated H-X9-DG protein